MDGSEAKYANTAELLGSVQKPTLYVGEVETEE